MAPAGSLCLPQSAQKVQCISSHHHHHQDLILVHGSGRKSMLAAIRTEGTVYLLASSPPPRADSCSWRCGRMSGRKSMLAAIHTERTVRLHIDRWDPQNAATRPFATSEYPLRPKRSPRAWIAPAASFVWSEVEEILQSFTIESLETINEIKNDGTKKNMQEDLTSLSFSKSTTKDSSDQSSFLARVVHTATKPRPAEYLFNIKFCVYYIRPPNRISCRALGHLRA